MATLLGDDKVNSIKDISNDSASEIRGFGADDNLFGETGIDKIYGGLGDDFIFGDTLERTQSGLGTQAIPFFYTEQAFAAAQVFADVLYGDAGRDAIYGGFGNDTIWGGDGDDSGSRLLSNGKVYAVGLFGGAGNDAVHGGKGVDRLEGNAGGDRLYGDQGNDELDGGLGADKLYGGTGDDLLTGGKAVEVENDSDVLDGGAGVDTASYFLSNGVHVSLDGSVVGTKEAKGDRFANIENVGGSRLGDDIISGNSKANEIFGEGGADTLYGRAGNDRLNGFTGNDKLYGGAGSDWLDGGSGKDVLNGGAGTDTIDYVRSGSVRVSLDGSLKATGDAFGDRIAAIENIQGSNTGSDMLSGNSASNTLWGLGGNDTLYGRAGNDFLNGDSGSDKLYGGAGNDWLAGDVGADTLDGGTGKDGASYFAASSRIYIALDKSFATSGEAVVDRLFSIENLEGSDSGGDKLAGNTAANTILGNGGNDTIYGRAGNDELFGENGRDRLFGELGKDFLNGGSGKDMLSGGKGDDTLVGGFGHDNLSGGDGTDVFRYDAIKDAGDIVTDFAKGDVFMFKGTVFAGLKKGFLHVTAFASNTTGLAEDTTDRFIYNTKTDNLYYDSNGSVGGGVKMLVADVTPNVNFSNFEIYIY
jgi:Ca2+-binding RTX toxin-like protein